MKDKEVIEQFETQDRYIKQLDKQLQEERINRMQLQNQQAQTSAFSQTPTGNLVEYQLELKQELDRIYHLLSGHIIGLDSEGNEVWIEAEDDRLKIFSEYGVKQIMNIISFYINKNTLMSYYDEETIRWKVRDFGIELADLIFNRYEVFFYYPTPEELFAKYQPIIRRKGYHINDEELYYKCVKWSREELQSKFRHYNMICMSIIDAVDSTYRRALKGEERDSLRKFMHISQNAEMPSSYNMQPSGFNVFKPSTWSRG